MPILSPDTGLGTSTNPYTSTPITPQAPAAPTTTANPFGPIDKGPQTQDRSNFPPVPANPITPGPSGVSSVTFGGGWQQFATEPGTVQYALMEGLLSGLSGQALVDQLNQNPATAGVAYYASTNTYGLPDGFYVAPTPGNPTSLDLIQRSTGATGTATAPTTLPTAATTVPPVAGLANDPNANSLFNLLMSQASQSADVLPTDPTVSAITNAGNTQLQRAATTLEQQDAEAQGSGANIGAQTAAAEENVGQQTSALQAQTMQSIMTQRIGEIETAMSGASGLLTAEQQMQLNQELTQLQDALQYAQLQESSYQFDNSPSTNPLIP